MDISKWALALAGVLALNTLSFAAAASATAADEFAKEMECLGGQFGISTNAPPSWLNEGPDPRGTVIVPTGVIGEPRALFLPAQRFGRTGLYVFIRNGSFFVKLPPIEKAANKYHELKRKIRELNVAHDRTFNYMDMCYHSGSDCKTASVFLSEVNGALRDTEIQMKAVSYELPSLIVGVPSSFVAGKSYGDDYFGLSVRFPRTGQWTVQAQPPFPPESTPNLIVHADEALDDYSRAELTTEIIRRINFHLKKFKLRRDESARRGNKTLGFNEISFNKSILDHFSGCLKSGDPVLRQAVRAAIAEIKTELAPKSTPSENQVMSAVKAQ
ncbi:MAG: hypothetical protein HY074_18395 [Deltaproteobacteria bacterium]|nr:hypothetical protein [Deltaproteobacteria bacterium]